MDWFGISFGVLGLFLLVVIVAGVAGLHVGDNSDGERVGELIKFSHRGWVWQTWEGELSMGAFSGSSSQVGAYVFDFSVCDFDANKTRALQDYIGKRVKIFYHSPMVLFGWTAGSSYCVEKVELNG